MARAQANTGPVLISSSTSTRAVAVDSLTLTPEPFALLSPFGRSAEPTRVMVFAMNLSLQPGDDVSAVLADAEDGSNRHYVLTVESIRTVPSYEPLCAVVFKLNDQMADVGDVLISVSYRGLVSNRVRIGVGHLGGGPPNDPGSVPTPAPPYAIRGQVTGSAGQGLSGIALTLSGPQAATAVTGAGGFYSFGVYNAGAYTLTPTSNDYYSFVPQTFTNFHLNETVNVTGTLRSYRLSGRLTMAGEAAPGMVVPLSGSETGSAVTDSNGEYSFTLPAGGNYTITPAITPALTYYEFQPGSLAVNDLHSDQPNNNFNAVRQHFTIGGLLLDQNGVGIAGRTVRLTDAHESSTVSDTNGYYQFASLPAGLTYTVSAPVNPYYTFTPSQTFSDLRSNQSANFTGTLQYYSVNGRVQLDQYPAVFLQLPISGSLTTTVTTDQSGWFSISLPAGGNYTLRPAATYYTFIPANLTFTDLTSHQENLFIQGLRQTFTLSGKLKDQESNGLPGLTVHLGGAEQRTTVTDVNGNYQFPNLLAGYNYTVAPPSTAAYTFAGQNVNDLRSDQTLDFVGLRRLQLNGRVLDQSGNGIIGIKVSLTGSESGASITTADGSYSLTATATGNYTITPSIPQDYYTFAPASAQLNNLAVGHTTNFSATLAPLPDPAYVLEFDSQPKTVDYGDFWQENVNLGHFFWEFWATPGPGTGATYMLSDGYGGAHALLFGVGSFNSSEPGRYELLGNIFDGVRFDNYFGSDVGPAVGEWGHFAVGWDGHNLITYFNGVPVGKTPFAGPRRTPGPGGGGGRLLIGGSDHANFDGRIAQVRGYEDTNPREFSGVEASYAPETVFSLAGNLLSYYLRPGATVADLSGGYNGVNHAGLPRGTTAGVLFDCGACPPPQFVIDPTAPNFAANVAPSPVNVPPPAVPPGGALVFDSFSRPNSTYVFAGHGGLGALENSSTGPQAWQTNAPAASLQPFGVLNSRAVLLANARSVAWVNSGSASGNISARVNRYSGRWGSGKNTGLSFRVIDAENFFFAYTSGAGETANPTVVHVGYYLNGNRVDLTTGGNITSDWTTLRVDTTTSGDLTVYVDGSLVISTTTTLLASATGAGLFNNSPGLGLTNRWDSFTVFESPCKCSTNFSLSLRFDKLKLIGH